MCWKKAGTTSSEKLSASHSQSMRPVCSFSGANSTWRKPRAAVAGSSGALSIRDLCVVREGPDGVDGERAARIAAVAVRYHETAVGTGADNLREGVLQREVVADAREVGAAVCGVEGHVLHLQEREPLEHPVGADERGDEVRGRVGQDVLRGVVLGEDAAFLEDGDLVAHLYRLVDVVGDEDDGLLYVLLDAEELLLEPVAGDRVDGPERLVHEHDRGVRRQGPRHPDALLLAAGELGRVAVAVLVGREADEVEQLVHAAVGALLIPSDQTRHGADVLADGAVGEEPYLLDGVADLAPELRPAHRGVLLAVDEDLALRRLDEPVDHPHARRLAATRRPDQDAYLAVLYVERQVVYDRPVGPGIRLAYALKLDHRVLPCIRPWHRLPWSLCIFGSVIAPPVALRNRAGNYTVLLRLKSKHPINIVFSRYITVLVNAASHRPTIALAGGGHANLYALRRTGELTRRGFDVVLVDPSEHLRYSGMATGVLSGSYEPGENRIGIRHLVERGGGRFVRGRVARVLHRDRALLLEDGRSVRYDAVSFCLGSETRGGDGAVPVKPVSNLEGVRERMLAVRPGAAPRVLVVGAGAAGCEVAVNLAALAREAGSDARITLVEAGPDLLPSSPEAARRILREHLRSLGVGVILGKKASPGGDGVVLEDGTGIGADLLLAATGVAPPDIFARSGLASGDDGALWVDRHLRSPNDARVFGGGG